LLAERRAKGDNAVIAEILAEAFVEIVGEALVSLGVRAIGKLFRVRPDLGPVMATFGLALLGGAIGFLSTVAFPHPLVRPSRVHGVSVLLSAFITGLAMSQIGRIARRRGWKTTRIESFGYGFVFALAMALVRFVMVK
jgi:hypothetical protein